MNARLLAAVLSALVLAPLAQAANNGPVFGLRALGNPKLGYFVYELAPGSTKQGAIIVSNTGNRAGTVKLYNVDATTGRTTGTVYLTDKKASATGAWVHLARASLTLAPGAHATVPFTVRVPAGAKPGQWVAGIVAETSQAPQGPKGTHKANVRIRIRNQTIVAVQVNVAGTAVSRFLIGSIKTGGQRRFQQVLVHLASTGNQLSKPHGTITIFDSQHVPFETLTFAMDTFLPHTAIDYPVLLKKALPPGDYQATVRLVVPGVAGALAKTVIATPSFSVSKTDVKQVFTSAQPTQTPPGGLVGTTPASVPWALTAAGVTSILLLVLLVALLVFQFFRRRRGGGEPQAPRRSASAGPAPEPAPAPEASAPAVAAPAAAAPVEPVAAAPAAPTPPQPEPVPFPAPVAPVAPVEPPAPEPAAVEPVPPIPAQTGSPACNPHFWDVAYDRGQLGGDGVWRFPHRCSTCGLELFAADVADASAQADSAGAVSR